MFPSSLSSSSGFTLIEMLFTVTVISVLLAIAIPAFLDHRQYVDAATMSSDLDTSANSMSQWMLQVRGGERAPVDEISTAAILKGRSLVYSAWNGSQKIEPPPRLNKDQIHVAIVQNPADPYSTTTTQTAASTVSDPNFIPNSPLIQIVGGATAGVNNAVAAGANTTLAVGGADKMVGGGAIANSSSNSAVQAANGFVTAADALQVQLSQRRPKASTTIVGVNQTGQAAVGDATATENVSATVRRDGICLTAAGDGAVPPIAALNAQLSLLLGNCVNAAALPASPTITTVSQLPNNGASQIWLRECTRDYFRDGSDLCGIVDVTAALGKSSAPARSWLCQGACTSSPKGEGYISSGNAWPVIPPR